MSENVVTSEDLVAVKIPKSFLELNKEQLVAVAEAFGTESEGTKQVILADLTESGVTFDQYLKAFHPTEPVATEPEPFVLPEPVDVEDWPDAPEGGEDVEEPIEIVTVERVPQLGAQKYLVKMVRDNPYFEYGRYKFTHEKPYAIMNPQDAQDILVQEAGFRQAFPDEVSEFYGQE